MLEANRIYLLQRFPSIYEALKNIKVSADFQLETTAVGLPTVLYRKDKQTCYLHDRQDPRKEAEQLIGTYVNIENSSHVVFYGVGLGYHIDVFVTRYPNIPYSIYEPNPELLFLLLKHRVLDQRWTHRLRNIFTESAPADGLNNVKQLTDKVSGTLIIAALPSYASQWNQNYERFIAVYKTTLETKRNNLRVSQHFQQNWTRNALGNFSRLIATPNVLHECQDVFRGRPVMLVAAGPSLEEEMEHLRYMKEKRLAYIISVGSSVNSLVEHGIFPHAACTYDPGEMNAVVFEKIKRLQIDAVPIIFGSSVGSSTLHQYPGPLLHMLMSQDTVSRVLLQRKDTGPLQILNDASSIAVVALQMLIRLGCTEIYLVGQNCAYKNNKYYSSGIDYKTELSAKELNEAITIEDVQGSPISSNYSLMKIKEELQSYIRANPHVKVVNTTKGGAKIEGAPYEEMKDVIANYLTKETADPGWFKQAINKSSAYNFEYMKAQLIQLKEQEALLHKLLKEMAGILQTCRQVSLHNDEAALSQLLGAFDRLFKTMQNNLFFKVFILPMNRSQYELLYGRVEAIKIEKHFVKKAEKVGFYYGSFLSDCLRCLEGLRGSLASLGTVIQEQEEVDHG